MEERGMPEEVVRRSYVLYDILLVFVFVVALPSSFSLCSEEEEEEEEVRVGGGVANPVFNNVLNASKPHPFADHTAYSSIVCLSTARV